MINNKTEKSNNFDSENDSDSNRLSNNKGNRKKFVPLTDREKSYNMNNNKKGEITKEFNLDQVLLTEGEVNKGPKRPPRKNSVRMSIFIRNMNKVDTVSTSKLMKVKKKKKKYT